METDSKEVVRVLGGLPLALAQAGSFMRQTNTNGSEYLSMYNDMWGALFKTSTTSFLRDYPDRSIVTTWTLSFQQIKKVGPDAAQLLLLWACLAYSDLWYELFVSFVHSQSMRQDRIPTWLTRSVGDQLTFKQTIKFLLDYSMVEAQIESSALYLHPVVHAWLFHEELKDKEEMVQLAALVVGFAIPTENELGYSILQRRLLPHCDRIHSLTQKASSFNVSHKEVTGYLMTSYHNLGLLYGDQGKLKEAVEMYQQALKGKEKAWGPEHTSTLDTVNNLGNLYRDQGKLEGAEEMYQRALKGYEKAWGPEHTSTLNTVNNLGNLYSDQGKLKEAEEMYQRALKGYEKAWGPEHTSTLGTVNNLGNLYGDQGKLKEAEEMYQRALKGYEKLRGRDHPNTMAVADNLRRLSESKIRRKRNFISNLFHKSGC
jgi:tetratricopeptide (TPR) repeat protein